MHMSKTEHSIVKLFFHPRLVKFLDQYVKTMVRNNKYHRVEFACKHSHSLRQRMCTNGHLKMLEWMKGTNLHIVAGNCGVLDRDGTHILALDMILAHPPATGIECDAQLTMCTVVLNAHASQEDIRRAHNHTHKIHSLMNGLYLLRCRSVLLIWGVNETFSEEWFLS
jgi:hypothetical protein